MLQMLIRGSNAVGYKSYPDNVNERFVELAAKNGIDVFRIFDCFNSVEQMQLCIDTVRKHNKIAEVCISFTGDFLSANEKIYTLEYFKDLAKRITEAGAHIIGIKDMAGLMKPQMVAPFVNAIRSVTDLPLHFHTHNTSSAALSTVINMANNGCDVVGKSLEEFYLLKSSLTNTFQIWQWLLWPTPLLNLL
jgi:pyruvate carboxylase